MNDQEKLSAVGQAMFGEQWQSATARLLGVDSRRIRHWMAATKPMPPGIWSELEEIIKDRIGTLENAAKLVEGSASEFIDLSPELEQAIMQAAGENKDRARQIYNGEVAQSELDEIIETVTKNGKKTTDFYWGAYDTDWEGILRNFGPNIRRGWPG